LILGYLGLVSLIIAVMMVAYATHGGY
jgi:hypothetical protein